jgi:hypothetical protein
MHELGGIGSQSGMLHCTFPLRITCGDQIKPQHQQSHAPAKQEGALTSCFCERRAALQNLMEGLLCLHKAQQSKQLAKLKKQQETRTASPSQDQ